MASGVSIISVLDGLVSGANHLISFTLQLNYVVGKTIFSCLSVLYKWLLFSSTAAVYSIKCAFEDFLSFLKDILLYSSLVCSCVDQTLTHIGNGIFALYYGFCSVIASFLGFILNIFGAFYSTLVAALDSIQYVVILSFKSAVLLLELLPFTAISFGEACWLRACFFWNKSNTLVAGAYKTLQSYVYNVTHAIVSLPKEVYVGFTIVLLFVLITRIALKAVVVNQRRIRGPGRRILQFTMTTLLQPSSWTLPRIRTTQNRQRRNSSRVSSAISFGMKLRNRTKNRSSVEKVLEEKQRLEMQLEQEKDKQLCVICQDKERAVILLPCRHFALCEPCVESLIQMEQLRCPVCRHPMEEYMPVYS